MNRSASASGVRISSARRLTSDYGPWLLVAWIAVIASGAATTGLLRAPVPNAVVTSLFTSHKFAGTVLATLGLAYMARASKGASAWPAAVSVIATIGLGWLSSGRLARGPVVAHACFAALTAFAIAGVVFDWFRPSPVSPPLDVRRPKWMKRTGRIAVGLMLLQVGIGSLLRHQLIGLVWHLMVGGLATLTLLVAAVAVLQGDGAAVGERRSARWAIASVLVQILLGASVWLMIVIGPPSIAWWLSLTVAHVTVGTLTMLATAAFARSLSVTGS